MQDPTFEQLVKLLEQRYGAFAPSVARQLLQAHHNFGSTRIRHVTVRK